MGATISAVIGIMIVLLFIWFDWEFVEPVLIIVCRRNLAGES